LNLDPICEEGMVFLFWLTMENPKKQRPNEETNNTPEFDAMSVKKGVEDDQH
jgi:hypothetical protein